MQNFWEMFTTTLGSAAVIAAVSTLFFSSKRRSNLHKNHKNTHRIIVAVLFGILSIYATLSAVSVGDSGALCNCRNLAPLYAGIVSGPVGGIGAALIGGLFRLFYHPGVEGLGGSTIPCVLACLMAGVVGSFVHIVIRKEKRYNVLTGVLASIVTEVLHMFLLVLFQQGEVAEEIVFPILFANICGMAYCMFIYKKFNRSAEEDAPAVAEEAKAEEVKAEAQVTEEPKAEAQVTEEPKAE